MGSKYVQCWSLLCFDVRVLYQSYIREYEDKQSVAEYLKSDQLKEDAKRIYGIKTNDKNDKCTNIQLTV